MKNDLSSLFRILVLILLAINTYLIGDLWVTVHSYLSHQNHSHEVAMGADDHMKFCPIPKKIAPEATPVQ